MTKLFEINEWSKLFGYDSVDGYCWILDMYLIYAHTMLRNRGPKIECWSWLEIRFNNHEYFNDDNYTIFYSYFGRYPEIVKLANSRVRKLPDDVWDNRKTCPPLDWSIVRKSSKIK